MNGERWKRIEEIFHAALEYPPDNRAAFLLEACREDRSILEEVQQLLASHENESSLFETPGGGLAAEIISEQDLRLDSIAQYKVLRRIGRGGMGEVYLAYDSRLNRKVALKLLPPEFTKDKDRVRRFEEEAKTVTALNHPYILTVYDVGQFQSSTFIAAEYIEGQTLREKMRSPMTLKEIVEITIQTAEALEAAHRAGIIHRDIKPENIMLRDDGYVKVLDFGLSRPVDTMPSSIEFDSGGRSVIGTLKYMSPEQLQGSKIDLHTDLFSLGIVLYEMLTGSLPFDGNTKAEIAEKIVHAEPKELGEYGEFPEALQSTVNKALQKDVTRRYQNARDLISDLRAVRRQLDLSEDLQHTEIPISGMHSRSSVRVIQIAAIIIVLSLITFFYIRSLPSTSSTVRSSKRVSIAVLPFEDLSPGRDQEYFSDGMAEELLNLLTRNPGIRVASRTSAFSFRGTQTDIKTIGEKLNVAYVVEGSVRKDGTRFRITAQLIDVATDSHLWSQTYDREMKDIFAIQDEIAGSISQSLDLTVFARRSSRLKQPDPDVYNLYLQGAYFLMQPRKENLEKAIDCFEQAIQLDPEFAPAWSGLSAVHGTQAGDGYIGVDEGNSLARQEAQKALELDPELGSAYNQIGWIKRNYEWDLKGAEAAFTKALELQPGSVTALRGLGAVKSTLGSLEEAILFDQRAIEIDPLLIPNYIALGFHCYYAGRLNESEVAFRNILKHDDNFPKVHAGISLLYLARLQFDQALIEIEREEDPFWRESGTVLVYHAMGQREKAKNLLSAFIPKYRKDPAIIGEMFAYIGDKDSAFEWLNRAFDEHDVGLSDVKVNPLLKNLHTDPRWARLLSKMQLPLN
jgi:serine/threonine-protein kinase